VAKKSSSGDNTNKVLQTGINKENRAKRQKKKDAASEIQALRRVGAGNVSWDAVPSKNGTGLFVKSSKGASQSMIRRLLSQGKIRQSANKLVLA
jgi:hypothetical protein